MIVLKCFVKAVLCCAPPFPVEMHICKLGSTAKGHVPVLSCARCMFVLWDWNFSCNSEGFSFGLATFISAGSLLDFMA